jgi:hypothetical protein
VASGVVPLSLRAILLRLPTWNVGPPFRGCLSLRGHPLSRSCAGAGIFGCSGKPSSAHRPLRACGTVRPIIDSSVEPPEKRLSTRPPCVITLSDSLLRGVAARERRALHLWI